MDQVPPPSTPASTRSSREPPLVEPAFDEEPRGESFQVLHTFLAVIILAIPVVTGVSAWLTARAFRAELFDEATRDATDVAENVFSRVDEEFLRPHLSSGTPIDLVANPEQLAQLERIVRTATNRHRVDKIYFFDLDGVITYSTVHEHIHERMPPGNSHFESARSGTIASVVRRRDNPLDISRQGDQTELLETYVPARWRDEQGQERIVGVVEVYQDTKVLNAAVRHATRRVAFFALLGMIVLGALFLLITLRADRELRRRGAALQRSNLELKALSRDLERQVEERTSQLIQKEKLASLGTLAAGVAHEINNPLATISTCAEGVQTRLSRPTPEEVDMSVVNRYLELISSEVFRCKGITQNLLDFSRQRVSTRREAFDINEVVRQSVELIQLGPRARSIDFDLRLSERRAQAVGDPVELRQIVHNLVNNSMDALRDSDRPVIRLTTACDESHVTLECEDSGPGVSRELRARIFEPFFTTKAPSEGTGLGLAVCYSIAERHEGVLEVLDPAPGGPGGARFRLSLRRADTDGVTR